VAPPSLLSSGIDQDGTDVHGVPESKLFGLVVPVKADAGSVGAPVVVLAPNTNTPPIPSVQIV
jgi:hypothetical protein